MKNSLFNLLGSVIAFSLPFIIAVLTGVENVVLAVLLAFFVQWTFFIPAYIFQTEKFYDLIGSVTYLSVVVFTLYNSDVRPLESLVVVGCVVVWAVRLGSFLFLRIKKAGEDKRFRSIKPSFTRFFMTWTLQGTWVSMCLLCVLTAVSSKTGVGSGFTFWLGLTLFVAGFSLEVIADLQKSNFKKIESNKDKFITSGLWGKSRHPNYLGELILWIGIAVMSITSLEGLQYLTLISPLFVYVLLMYISGVRMLEESGEKKWGHLDEYKKHLEDTPKFFLRLNKKHK
jgi:steroid 5-alpha reductase family enzyme|tara:strand:+ start:1066 stop:1920 length:855 start_codon:yes stop_codon:yes gene_type:complete